MTTPPGTFDRRPAVMTTGGSADSIFSDEYLEERREDCRPSSEVSSKTATSSEVEEGGPLSNIKSSEPEFRRLLARYGIKDEDSGREAAWTAREYILSVGRTVIPNGPIAIDHLVVCGVVARAQSLHEACVTAIESNNPHAAFTLLRAYAEQCAAILFMTDHPDRAEKLWNDVEGHGVQIGRITNYAHRSGKIPNFRALYEQLSRYAHPSSAAHFASMRVDEDRSLTWQSAPRFKRDDDKLMAYVWCIELAQAVNRFTFEFAIARGLGFLAPAEETGVEEAIVDPSPTSSS